MTLAPLATTATDATHAAPAVVAWTLCVEVTFYLALPLYAGATARLTRRLSVRGAMWVQLAILTMLAAGATALRYLNWILDPTFPIQNSLLSLFYWFALGMALAVVSSSFQSRPLPGALATIGRRPAACWSAAFVVHLVPAAINGRVRGYSLAQEILG